MVSCVLTKEQEDLILKEIGYNRAQLQRDVPNLRLWLKEQVHLPPSRLTEPDAFLTSFLVGSKGSVETAKRKLDLYYSLRGKGEVFSNRDNLDYVDIVANHSTVVQLPKPTADNCTVFVARLSDPTIDLYNGVDALKYSLLLFEHRLRSGTGILGQAYYILDASMYTISHLLTIPPAVIRTYMSFFQDAFPLRVKRIIVANAPAVLASSVNTLVLPFLNKKIKDRFSISSDPVEKVFKLVESLPSDYQGGSLPSLSTLSEKWRVELLQMKDFASHLEVEADESKRPQLKDGMRDNFFGLHGSIKTLVLD